MRRIFSALTILSVAPLSVLVAQQSPRFSFGIGVGPAVVVLDGDLEKPAIGYAARLQGGVTVADGVRVALELGGARFSDDREHMLWCFDLTPVVMKEVSEGLHVKGGAGAVLIARDEYEYRGVGLRFGGVFERGIFSFGVDLQSQLTDCLECRGSGNEDQLPVQVVTSIGVRFGR